MLTLCLISNADFTDQDDKPNLTPSNTVLSDAQNKLTENSLPEPSNVVTQEDMVEGYAGMNVDQVAAKIVGQVLERVVRGAVGERGTEEGEGRRVSGGRRHVCDRVLKATYSPTHAHTHPLTHTHTHTHTDP